MDLLAPKTYESNPLTLKVVCDDSPNMVTLKYLVVYDILEFMHIIGRESFSILIRDICLTKQIS